MGRHLCKALNLAGYSIKHIISRSSLNNTTSLGIIDPEVLVLNDIGQVTEEPDMYLLCVQDAEITELANFLAGSEALVAHTSGGTGMDVFKNRKAAYGVFYPMQTFTKGVEIEYTTIPFLLEASDPDAMMKLEEVARKISGDYYQVDSAKRLRIHTAAVFASNFTNHMIHIAESLLKESGMDLEVLKPLMEQTFKKLQSMQPSEAQTGPAVRGDKVSMQRHLELLNSDPELQEIYKLISSNIAKEKDTR